MRASARISTTSCVGLSIRSWSDGIDESWLDHDDRLRCASGDTDPSGSYAVDFRVLNAADFGVQQKRVRLFIQAVRRDLTLSITWPRRRTRKPCSWRRRGTTGVIGESMA